MRKVKVHEGFYNDKRVEEHWPNVNVLQECKSHLRKYMQDKM